MTAYDERDTFGSYLEEFEVGDTWKHWPGKTITEADNHMHSLLVMNHHPLHIDVSGTGRASTARSSSTARWCSPSWSA